MIPFKRYKIDRNCLNQFSVCAVTLELITFAPYKDFGNCELFPPTQAVLIYKYSLSYWLSSSTPPLHHQCSQTQSHPRSLI